MQGLRLTRRQLLFTTGSGVLGISVLNTLSGCTTFGDEPPPADSASAAASAASSAAGPASTGDWKRVDLSFVSAYLLVRDSEVAVVDLGTAGSADAIGAALTAAGRDWKAVKHVVLTHQHADHAGGLVEVRPLVSASLYAGEADVLGLDAPADIKPVKDGDEVFGLRIIGTPGHTAGHISVFDPSTGVLVAGDALRTTDGLASSDPQYTADAAQASASVRKLAALDVKTILPGHGAPLTSGAADELRKLAASLP
jgi:glyoxylase-like metal-dependent hydrolase (beta-lactamase superfamily II)